MALAPIIVFAYKRPQLLARTLDSLSANALAAESQLFVYCDGPKPNASGSEREAIKEVERIARAAKGFADVSVRTSEGNKGLSRSVIDGVTELVVKYGKVIVVEDDVLLSPHFLRFMNDALIAFEHDDRVCSVGSWNYFADPVRLKGNFFLRYPDSIAWATWQRSWRSFEQDGKALLHGLREKDLLRVLDADGMVDYFSSMLRDQVEGRVDSWAIRWTANAVLNGSLTYFPRVSLAKHMGTGADATHETGSKDYNEDLALAEEAIAIDTPPVQEDAEAFRLWVAYVKANFVPSSLASWKRRIHDALPQRIRQWLVRRRTPTGADPAALAFEPVSRVFGMDRGQPVDRYYIERFLASNRALIMGHVLEIGDASYTRMFGSGALRSEVLRYEGEPAPGVRIGDLTDLGTLPESEVDLFICTQTLNFIYEVRQAITGIHHVLKPGGHALVTVAGLVQISRYDADRWGDFWRFTPGSAERLFTEVFGEGNVTVGLHGNSYAAACLMKGFATEECDRNLLDQVDADLPVVITIKARRAS